MKWPGFTRPTGPVGGVRTARVTPAGREAKASRQGEEEGGGGFLVSLFGANTQGGQGEQGGVRLGRPFGKVG